MSKITFWPALLAGVVVAALAMEPASAQKKYDAGASDTEIKIGQTMPYSGPASVLRHHWSSDGRLFPKGQCRGWRQRPQDYPDVAR